MGSDDDNEALSWPGDKPDKPDRADKSDNPTAPTEPPARRKKVSERSFDEIIDPGPRAQLPAWALLVFGLFAGVYLLFTVAWLIIALNPPVNMADAFSSFMWVGSLWFATAGGLLWFGATLILGANRTLGWRLVMLLVGALVLIPWPYIALALS